MQNIAEIYNQFLAKVAGWLAGVTAFQALAAGVLLLALIIIFICALSAKGRKCDQLEEDVEKAKSDLQRAGRENARAIEEKDNEIRHVEQERTRLVNEKNAEIAGLRETIGALQKFHDEYSAIPDARAESARIIREAKEHAYMVSNRTEQEYAEIIEHANQEAEAIRGVAQARLTRSHEALKQALARSSEIVEEARVEAARVGKIAYMAAPNLIEAPQAEEEADKPAPEAPAPDSETPGEEVSEI